MFFSSSTTSTVAGMCGMVTTERFDLTGEWNGAKYDASPERVTRSLAAGGPMRRVVSLVLPVIAALAFAACAPKLKPGECKSSADCAGQAGYGKVCVQGRCQECSADTDCQAGF